MLFSKEQEKNKVPPKYFLRIMHFQALDKPLVSLWLMMHSH